MMTWNNFTKFIYKINPTIQLMQIFEQLNLIDVNLFECNSKQSTLLIGPRVCFGYDFYFLQLLFYHFAIFYRSKTLN